MDIHDSLAAEHAELRSIVATISSFRSKELVLLDVHLTELKHAVRQHFAREERYYRIVDVDKRFSDRGLIHQFRNDHAGMLFGMESLTIRLRKNGAAPEWWDHFDKLMAVFLPHMDQEENVLFPEAERLLTPSDWETIRQGMDRE